jgi:hypothetical protein
MEVEMRTTEIAADFGALTDTDLDLVEGAVACSPCDGPGHNTKGAGGASGIADTPGIGDAVRGVWWNAMG